VGAKEVTTNTRANLGAADHDNYGGGDDNYPRSLTVIGVEGPKEGTGWSRQK
jgi:hypothetical protein